MWTNHEGEMAISISAISVQVYVTMDAIGKSHITKTALLNALNAYNVVVDQ